MSTPGGHQSTIRDVVGVYCYARACTAKREGDNAMCDQHWRLLTPGMRKTVTRAIGAYLHASPGKEPRTALRVALVAAKNCVDTAERQAEATAREAAK